MPIDSQVLSAMASPATLIWDIPRLGVLFLSVLYFVFSLIVLRQINLMSETLISETSPILKASAILHCGFALGIIILFIGFLFG